MNIVIHIVPWKLKPWIWTTGASRALAGALHLGLNGPSWGPVHINKKVERHIAHTLIFTMEIINALKLTIRGFCGDEGRGVNKNDKTH